MADEQNVLAELRTRLADALDDAQLDAHPYTLEKVTPPVTFVGPADPYVSLEDANVGCALVRHDVVLVVGKGVNEELADDVDLRILRALAALPEDFAVDDSRVGYIPLNGQTFTGAVLTVLTEIELPDLQELLP